MNLKWTKSQICFYENMFFWQKGPRKDLSEVECPCMNSSYKNH
jgi:hypothetical protein